MAAIVLFYIGLLVSRGFATACHDNVPEALSFVEPLDDRVQPAEIVIFTGGDSYERRITGFANMSSASIEAFTAHHGYSLQFLDELNYNYRLEHNGHKFSGHWHRVFALPALRKAHPDAKYFVWLDDDILVPYPQSDMLNHYINMMESNFLWQMLYTEEAEAYVLNSGMFIMRNNNLTFWAYEEAIKIGCENGGYLSWHFGHEQTAIAEVRHRHRLQQQIQVLKHRDGPYNMNTFARWAGQDSPEMRVQPGDAFVHFLGGNGAAKLKRMQDWMWPIEAWRQSIPKSCEFPVELHK